ncbi:hypothetical protein LGH70_19885 [Hymenobacter sp. BT635]|uniref:Uncharacterized protein n=1 Tax=Hymenobacter nitidus TaxID=2880929 RepID=A0ABS8AHG5_9BACT|nr:hypothetical protein [Hymenobacter nitidus]MCB2379868.1 hypothetical protein [Hymenobacter nitidus]
MEANQSTAKEGELLSYAELQYASDFLHSPEHSRLQNAVDFLLNAVTDWPIFGLSEPKDLLANLHIEITGPLTFNALRIYATVASDPWKGEAINSLLELFDSERKQQFNLDIELEAILIQLTHQCRMVISPTAR